MGPKKQPPKKRAKALPEDGGATTPAAKRGRSAKAKPGGVAMEAEKTSLQEAPLWRAGVLKKGSQQQTEESTLVRLRNVTQKIDALGKAWQQYGDGVLNGSQFIAHRRACLPNLACRAAAGCSGRVVSDALRRWCCCCRFELAPFDESCELQLCALLLLLLLLLRLPFRAMQHCPILRNLM